MDVAISFLCPEELLKFQVPKNILQPLVENSLLHGLYDVKTGQISGRIDIGFPASMAITPDYRYR